MKKKFPAIIFFIVFAGAVIAGATYFVYKKSQPFFLLGSAIQQAQDIHTLAFTLTGNTEFKNALGTWNIHATMPGHFSSQNQAHTLLGNVAIQLISPLAEYNNKNIRFDMVTASDNNARIKLLEAPRFFGLDFSPVYNTWIELSQADFVKTFPAMQNSSASVAGLVFYSDQIKAAFMSGPFIEFTNTERIVYQKKHAKQITYRVDPDKLNTFVTALMASTQASSTPDVIAIKDFIQTHTAQGMIVIDSDDYVRKVSIDIVPRQKNLDSPQPYSEHHWEVSFDSFNETVKPFEIGKVLKYNEAMLLVTKKAAASGASGQTLQPPVDLISSEPDTDKDGLADFIEEKFGSDPNNPDSDGDGFSDGEEFKAGYMPKGGTP